jgi:hypothetical protein
VIIENEKTKIEKDFSKKYPSFMYKNKNILILKVHLSNAEFSWREDTHDYLLDQWTYDIDFLCDGVSYNIYDTQYSNRDGMPTVLDEDIGHIIIEEMENADDLFTFNNKEVSI